MSFADGLPPAKMSYDKLVRTVNRKMEARELTQSEVCRALSLSPVYLSIWLRQKDGMPASTRGLYSAALELWVADAALTIDDPALTNTKASQVPPSRPAGSAAPKRKAPAESQATTARAPDLDQPISQREKKRARLGIAPAASTSEQPATEPAAPNLLTASAGLQRQLLEAVRAIERADEQGLLSTRCAPAAPCRACCPPAPPSLAAMVQRLKAGGYATVAALLFDFDALAAAAAAGVSTERAAQLKALVGESRTALRALLARCPNAPLGAQSGRDAAAAAALAASATPEQQERAATPSALERELTLEAARRRAASCPQGGPTTANGTARTDVAAGARGDGGAEARPTDVAAQLVWAADHFPRFVPAPSPCEALIDGRARVTLLGSLPPDPQRKQPQQPQPDLAVVGGYFCKRPVLVDASRCEVKALSAVASGDGRCTVKWADGVVSDEAAARHGVATATAAVAPPGAAPTPPAGWAALLAGLEADGASKEQRERLERDAAAWGFGAVRRGAAPQWDDAAASLLERHLSLGGVEAAAAPALHARMTVAVALVLGRSVGYVRQRWHEHQSVARAVAMERALSTPPPADDEAAATGAGPPQPPHQAGRGGKAVVGSSGKRAEAAPASSTVAGAGAEAGAGGEAGAACSDGGRLARLHAAVGGRVWRLAELMMRGNSGELPPQLWRLSQLEASWSGSAAAAQLRERIKQIETAMYGLEAQLAGTSEEAAEAAAASDSRRFVFRIDDITHDLPGGVAGPFEHRQRISAINDVDDELFPDILYLHSCIGGDGVEIAGDAAFLTGCSCEESCTLECGCHCCQEQVVQGGEVAYDKDGRLMAPPGTPIFECNAACSCPGDCRNRVVQRGPSVPLQVYKTNFKGWGVRTLGHIPAGTFVVEYTGEIITTDEAERRGAEYDAQGFSTLFDLDAAGADCEYTIDATYKCGVARFLNHSCAPNLRQYSVWVDNVSLALPRIAFFATRDIEAGEELNFDYKYQEGGRNLACHCGAKNCRKWLY